MIFVKMYIILIYDKAWWNYIKIIDMTKYNENHQIFVKMVDDDYDDYKVTTRTAEQARG